MGSLVGPLVDSLVGSPVRPPTDSLVRPTVRPPVDSLAGWLAGSLVGPPVELQALPDCSKFQQIRALMFVDQLLHLEIPRADPGVRRQIFERIATLDRR